jgi:hypothetical protein
MVFSYGLTRDLRDAQRNDGDARDEHEEGESAGHFDDSDRACGGQKSRSRPLLIAHGEQM